MLVQDIVELCNKKIVYETLFRYKQKGEPYIANKAESYIEYIKNGWDNQTHFIFGIFSEQKKLAGIVEIKSNNLEIAEIGYMVNDDHHGIMSKAVKILCDYGKEKGYKKFGAKVKTINSASQNVLLNNGFVKIGPLELEEDKFERFWFEKELI